MKVASGGALPEMKMKLNVNNDVWRGMNVLNDYNQSKGPSAFLVATLTKQETVYFKVFSKNDNGKMMVINMWAVYSEETLQSLT